MTPPKPDLDMDLLIIGAGPAGLTAALYGARAGLTVYVFERGEIGGQVAMTDYVENYPGFPEPIEGRELMERMKEQATRFGAQIVYDEIERLERDEAHYLWAYGTDGTYRAKAVIIAVGSDPRKLGVPGEEEFTGRGVSYCAVCDGHFFKDQVVAVVGGGDSAKTEALYLTNLASKVYLIHRRDRFRGEKILEDRVRQNPKIELVLNTVVEEILGDQQVRALRVRNVQTQEVSEIPVSGVFIYIGHIPNTGFLKGFVELDETGHIPTDSNMQTSVPGVFAAGDVRSGSLRQITTSVGDAAIAATRAGEYIEKIFGS